MITKSQRNMKIKLNRRSTILVDNHLFDNRDDCPTDIGRERIFSFRKKIHFHINNYEYICIVQ
jgi:hypothetical protein